MAIECPCCGTDIEMLPAETTEQQARQALRAVLIWYSESPIREIQTADAACGRRFPIKAIEDALKNTSKIMHASDCAIYNAPALPVGPCNCGVELAASDRPKRLAAVRLVSAQDTPSTKTAPVTNGDRDHG